MIQKRGRNFWLDIRVRGRRIRRSLGTPERALAIERARDIALELRNPKPPGTTIADFASRYLDWARETKPASYAAESYRVSIIKAYFAKAGISALDEVTPYHIEQFRAEVRTQDRRSKQARPASKATANRYCALLRVMFNKARDWGMFHLENPVSKVRFFKEGGKVRPLSEAEIGRVLDAARAVAGNPQSPAQAAIADLVILMLNTGLRTSEALNLRWSDIGDDGLRVRGKGGKFRFVPLNTKTRDLLNHEKRLTQYVFDIPNRHQPDALRRTVKRIRKLSEVAHFHLHLCRHYAMTAMLGAGVDIQTAAEILGHSRITTSLIYAHSSPERKRRAVESIAVGTVCGQGPVDVEAQVAEK